jgi:hypothetical protein
MPQASDQTGAEKAGAASDLEHARLWRQVQG